MKNHNEILASQIKAYDHAVDAFGVTSKAVMWDDPQTQYFRFAELIRCVDLNDDKKKLLDVGCGNGEFFKFLNLMGYRGTYTGYDINKKLLAQAEKRFASINVKNVNILSNEPSDKEFDYVTLSGVFNMNTGQTPAYVYEFLTRMFSMCNIAIAFNLISTHVTFRDERMFYLDPAETLAFCIANLSKRTSLYHGNLPYNYTVIVYKNESWSSVKECYLGE